MLPEGLPLLMLAVEEGFDVIDPLGHVAFTSRGSGGKPAHHIDLRRETIPHVAVTLLQVIIMARRHITGERASRSRHKRPVVHCQEPKGNLIA